MCASYSNSNRGSAAMIKHLKKELSRLAKKFSRQEAEIYRLQKDANEFDDVRERLEVRVWGWAVFGVYWIVVFSWMTKCGGASKRKQAGPD